MPVPVSSDRAASALPDLATPWFTLLERARERAGDDPTARYVQLASVDADGSPRCRSVVAREVDEQSLRLVTDARAAKVPQLTRESRVEVCWYFAEAREQFRLRGHARRLAPDDPVHRRLWLAQSPPSRASFTWPPPGTPRLDADVFADTLTDESSPPSFAVLEIVLTAIDWLSLRSHPHERRLFTRTDDTWHPTRLRPEPARHRGSPRPRSSTLAPRPRSSTLAPRPRSSLPPPTLGLVLGVRPRWRSRSRSRPRSRTAH